MNVNQLHSVYFVGIGGMGMSALARFFRGRGVRVYGYDRTRSALCKTLESEGMKIHYTDDPNLIPQDFDEPAANKMVVYTPAVPQDHRELTQLRKTGYKPLKRSEVLGLISKQYKTVAVAGTHGKTTTSALIAHILVASGKGCNAFLGGISTNYNSNVIVDESSNLAVIEADEYDRSFLTLWPNWAVVTSVETDHLDVYGDSQSLVSAFNEFIGQVDSEGVLVAHEGATVLDPSIKTLRYSIGDAADICAHNVHVESGAYHFDLVARGTTLKNVKLGLPGRHNVENALAAAGIALALEVPQHKIGEALSSFRGVKRRFEVHVQTAEMVYIDDYAHHPTEVSACLSSIKEMYPDKRIVAVFQPHLYSRTRDFAAEFAEALSQTDEVILMEIYPAREKPIPGVSSGMLLNLIEAPKKQIMTGEELVLRFANEKPEVLVSLGAGDIDRWVGPITKALKS